MNCLICLGECFMKCGPCFCLIDRVKLWSCENMMIFNIEFLWISDFNCERIRMLDPWTLEIGGQISTPTMVSVYLTSSESCGCRKHDQGLMTNAHSTKNVFCSSQNRWKSLSNQFQMTICVVNFYLGKPKILARTCCHCWCNFRSRLCGETCPWCLAIVFCFTDNLTATRASFD